MSNVESLCKGYHRHWRTHPHLKCRGTGGLLGIYLSHSCKLLINGRKGNKFFQSPQKAGLCGGGCDFLIALGYHNASTVRVRNDSRGHVRRHFSRTIFSPPHWVFWLIPYLHPQPLEGGRGVASGESSCQTKKAARLDCFSSFERKTRVCPSALYSVYQAITFAQYYTPNSGDTWVVSRCRFRVRLLPYKLQNYSCLRQIYE